MALPILAIAAAARILGPVAVKAAKIAYKTYKKRNKNPDTYKEFLSKKANAIVKKDKTNKRIVTGAKVAVPVGIGAAGAAIKQVSGNAESDRQLQKHFKDKEDDLKEKRRKAKRKEKKGITRASMMGGKP